MMLGDGRREFAEKYLQQHLLSRRHVGGVYEGGRLRLGESCDGEGIDGLAAEVFVAGSRRDSGLELKRRGFWEVLMLAQLLRSV
jgi:hypothetical protein